MGSLWLPDALVEFSKSHKWLVVLVLTFVNAWTFRGLANSIYQAATTHEMRAQNQARLIKLFSFLSDGSFSHIYNTISKKSADWLNMNAITTPSYAPWRWSPETLAVASLLISNFLYVGLLLADLYQAYCLWVLKFSNDLSPPAFVALMALVGLSYLFAFDCMILGLIFRNSNKLFYAKNGLVGIFCYAISGFLGILAIPTMTSPFIYICIAAVVDRRVSLLCFIISLFAGATLQMYFPFFTYNPAHPDIVFEDWYMLRAAKVDDFIWTVFPIFTIYYWVCLNSFQIYFRSIQQMTGWYAVIKHSAGGIFFTSLFALSIVTIGGFNAIGSPQDLIMNFDIVCQDGIISLMQDPKISSDIYTYFIASALLAPLFLLLFWIISVLCMKLLSPLVSVTAEWLFRLVSQGGEAGQTAAGRMVQFAVSLVAFYLLLTFILLPAGLHQG